MSCVLHATNHVLNVSSDIEKNLIAQHVSSSLFMSAASGEREDALPQTPECTNSTGLFEEAAGQFQFTFSNSRSVTLWTQKENEFEPILS